MHHAIYISNQEDKAAFLSKLSREEVLPLNDTQPAIYSKLQLLHFLRLEHQYDRFDLTGSAEKPLALMSEGEQRKALLAYLLKQKPKTLIVDDVFDSLDVQSQEELAQQLHKLSQSTQVIQLYSRKRDLLPFIQELHQLVQGELHTVGSIKADELSAKTATPYANKISPAFFSNIFSDQQGFLGVKPLINLHRVSIEYNGRTILQPLDWQVKQGEFWQLVGPNGSGKSSLLKLITGDSPKGFGQDVTLFGYKKGSGESVWDIKQHIGYFTSSITQNFTRYQSVEDMLLSGFFDSIGLYQKPSKQQIRAAEQWLQLIGLADKAKASFASLSIGHQRLLLVSRAMLKMPPLLILDEPSAGLDDKDIHHLLELVNSLAATGRCAIIYVSHRQEQGLEADHVLELTPTEQGSKAIAHSPTKSTL